MDLDGTIALARAHFTGYIEEFVRTASGARFDKASQSSADQLDGRLWTFVVLSAGIGAALGGLTGLGAEAPLWVVMVFLLTNWCGFSFWAYLLCRFVLGGRARFMNTLATLLYVLPVIFVACHFIALLVKILYTPFGGLVPDFSPEYVPAIAYLGVQALLLAIYLPLNLGVANGFGVYRTAALVTFVPLPLLAVNTAMLYALIFLEDFEGFAFAK